MDQIKRIKQYADHLRLTMLRNQAERFIHQAQIDKPSYLDYTRDILEQEVQQRQKTDMERRVKLAHLPRNHNLEFYDYAFASALLQSEGLTEYISNYHRRMYSSSSAIFWMYNDSWPVTHGWTIVDYYLRKKLAYHPVRRSFQQTCVVVAEEGDKINIYGINDKQQSWKGKLQYGLFETGGKLPVNETKNVILPPNASTLIASFEKSVFEREGIKNHGAFAVLKEHDTIISQYRLFLARFKDLALLKPQVSIRQSGDKAIITSTVYVWGLCLDINGESDIADNCFDLLPGIPYTVNIRNGEKVQIMMTGNDLMNR